MTIIIEAAGPPPRPNPFPALKIKIKRDFLHLRNKKLDPLSFFPRLLSMSSLSYCLNNLLPQKKLSMQGYFYSPTEGTPYTSLCHLLLMQIASIYLFSTDNTLPSSFYLPFFHIKHRACYSVLRPGEVVHVIIMDEIINVFQNFFCSTHSKLRFFAALKQKVAQMICWP